MTGDFTRSARLVNSTGTPNASPTHKPIKPDNVFAEVSIVQPA
nr:hypothetical protein [Nostoc sp. DedQUE03]